MAATTFQKLLQKGARQGADRNWFRNVAKTISMSPSKLMAENKKRLKLTFEIGQMYSYHYDPKHKETLPYYDTFPLTFPIGPAPGGFYALNTHYLPHTQRAALMDALYTVQSADGRSIMISYKILQQAAKFKFFKPTLKHYLYAHVRSKFLHIPTEEWDLALMSPLARFKKASAAQVWKDSLK